MRRLGSQIRVIRALVSGTASLVMCAVFGAHWVTAAERPNVVLVMADDMGWGQTGYRGHPLLKTPNLDAMAASGLRFERFYAGAPNCSPTRATVMTGRTNNRTGVENHGYGLRRSERTVAAAMRQAGYQTAHFGKWHLSGFRGPGAPILKGDPRGPGPFGFERWLSVTNFFDRDPLLSREGEVEAFRGDSSEIVIDEALRFARQAVSEDRNFLAVVWFGTPHSPFRAAPGDTDFDAELDRASREHYGELVAMDRSIGTLRRGLRDLGISQNTMVWFCGDNGGLPRIKPETVGGLRGFKNTVYEGGLRVPAIIEWPAGIPESRVTEYPACTTDIFPTLVDVLGLPGDSMLQPVDGVSLQPLFTQSLTRREQPLGFRHTGRAAWIDNDYKLVTTDLPKSLSDGRYELYDLRKDPREEHDLSAAEAARVATMRKAFEAWNASVQASMEGADYAAGEFDPEENQPSDWAREPGYQPYLDEWKSRPEFSGWLNRPALRQ